MKTIFQVGLFFALFLCCASQVFAETVTYQGKLTDSDGPVSGVVAMKISVYDDNGTAAKLLYEEEHAGVNVDSGIFNVPIGGGTPTGGLHSDISTAVLYSASLWLEVTVNGDILAPRTEITTTPSAIWADEAGNADTIDTIHAADLALKTDLDWNNLANIPAGIADGDNDTLATLGCVDGQIAKWNNTAFAWQCQPEAGSVNWVDGAGKVITTGNVGIGVVYPDAKLHVVDGDVKVSGGNIELGREDADAYIELVSDTASALTTMRIKSLDNVGFAVSDEWDNNRLVVTELGNVGIGTTSPAERLDVSGKIKGQSLQVTTGAVAGHVLVSDAVGNATWQATPTETLALGDLSDGIYIGSSLFLGAGAGTNDDGSDNLNMGIGHHALKNNTTGFNNTASGYYAMSANIDGAQNTASGSHALGLNTSGNYNTGNGYGAINQNISGAANTASGYLALYYNTTGNYNVGLGPYANYSNQEGSNNTMVGFAAGQGASLHNKSGNVFLGYKAGFNETGDNKLYIDNSDTGTPLIYGDFAADALAVNGTVDITGNAAIGSAASVNSAITLNVAGDSDDTVTGYFTNNATFGVNSALHGKAQGVTNRANNDMHWGVLGEASGGKYNAGLYGDATDSSGATENYGVFGTAAGGTNNYAGYFLGNFVATGNAAIGYGATIDSQKALKVIGDADDMDVGFFINKVSSGRGYGVYGSALEASPRNTGDKHYGVYGEAGGGLQNFGLFGYAHADSATNYGVYARASGNSAANYAGYFEGNVHVTGAFTNPSDFRLKENIRPVEDALAKVEAINGVYYNKITTPEVTEVGVIAQAVQAVLPEAVRVIDPENGYLGVSYSSLIPLLIEAVKEQQLQIKAIQTENTEKDAVITALTALVCQEHPEVSLCQ